jgi:hypothetical protein
MQDEINRPGSSVFNPSNLFQFQQKMKQTDYYKVVDTLLYIQ